MEWTSASQSSKSEGSLTQTTQQGSSLTAGKNLRITATGTDIKVQGGQLQAGKDVALSAERDVNLVSAQESSSTRGQSSSSGYSVGAGFTAGSGGAGFNVSASVNKGKGHENADGLSHAETQVNAGGQVTITSGRDTTLAGAQVSGETVKADVGRNLTISSEQDSETFDAKQQNASAGAGYTVGGAATISVSASRDRMNSDWRSVTEQSGIFAGSGGFDITVGEHTQLDGAVIGSTAEAEKNNLDTGTLGWRDIDNHAAYEVEHAGAGVSTGGSVLDQFKGNMANGLLAGLNGSDSADSTTRAAVSEGTITVRDRENQTQDVAELSRDVENANPGLEQIFDREKEQKRLKAAQLIGEIGVQVADIARTQGQIAGEKAKKDPAALQAAREQLAGQGNLNPTDKQIADQAYNTAMVPFGTGSSLQQGIQAATAAIQGLAGGNISQAISGAASPYLAEQIHKLTEGNPEAQAMAHAVVGAVTSYASGNSALAGAAGAVSGELMAQLVMSQLYPGKSVSELTETEKQTISALGTLAGGLAGGVTGDSTADAVAGALAGQNSVNNNLFGGNEEAQAKFVQEHGKDVLSCADDPSSVSCQRGEAVNKAIAVALGAGAAGGVVVAATPELIAAVQAAASACAGNPVLCANEVSIWVAEMAAGDALPAGLTVATVGKMSATELSELKALMTVEKQTGSKVTKESLESVVTSSGGKGNWNKELNNPQPNTIYKVDGNKTYQTDAQGRVATVEADLSALVKDRNTYQQCKAGKCGVDGDEGGHLIASIFDGPGEKLNLVPMDGNLNKGVWKQMENTWANALKDGKQVNVKIEPVYSGDSVRPESFNVIYTIDGGRPKEQTFMNAPGGK